MPIIGLYSYKQEQATPLRKVAQRTLGKTYRYGKKLSLVGTIATLASSIANVSAVFVLKGQEPAFVCPFIFSILIERYVFPVVQRTWPSQPSFSIVPPKPLACR